VSAFVVAVMIRLPVCCLSVRWEIKERECYPVVPKLGQNIA